MPSKESIRYIITTISVLENINLSRHREKTILDNCGYDIKKAIWQFDTKNHTGNSKIPLDKIVDEIVKLIMDILCPTNKNIIKSIFMEIRTIIYSPLITNIDGSKIMTIIMDKLIDIIGKDHDEVNIRIIRITSEYEHNLSNGRREITDIDPFISKILKVLYSNRKKLIKL